MQPITRLKSVVKRLGIRAGYEIRRMDESSTMHAALRRIAARHRIATVIDIGASDGRWSLMAMEHLPGASYLLIEAQEVHERALRVLSRRDARVQYVLAAAGDHDGEIHFDTSDPFGGAAGKSPFDQADAIIPMTCVDTEVNRLGLQGPYLLKLDTHGFEHEILQGALSALADTSVLIIEAYNFTLRPGAWRFHELTAHMDMLGFRAVDLVNVLRRPADDVLWQFDLVFSRSDGREFQQTAYETDLAPT